jgi:hypothetical protein
LLSTCRYIQRNSGSKRKRNVERKTPEEKGRERKRKEERKNTVKKEGEKGRKREKLYSVISRRVRHGPK